MAVYRVAWWSVTVAMACCGIVAAVAGLRGAVLALVLAGAAVGCWTVRASGAVPWDDVDRAGRFRLARAGAVGAVLAVAVAGLAWLLGTSAIALSLVVAAAAPSIVGRFAVAPVDVSDGGVQQPNVESDLRALSDADLQAAWRRSFVRIEVTTDPIERSLLAALRCDYLDEFERRDPDGFTRWLDNGARAAGNPARFAPTRPEAADPTRDPDQE
jgi:hypothetical protein